MQANGDCTDYYDSNNDSDGDEDNEDDEYENDFTADDAAPIAMPYNFIMECQKYHQVASIKDVLKKSKAKGCKINTAMGKLIIKSKKMKELLMTEIQKIIEHVKDLKEKRECQKLNAIFLVGGFSECKILQTMIRKSFKTKNCDIVVPVCPSLAIVKGSISFGFNPTIISQRISAYTYGLGKLRSFQADDKPDYKYVNSEGKVYCQNIFMEIIRELAPITKQNCKFKTNFIPLNRHQQSIGVSLYKSKSVNVKYITDDGIEKLGHLCVPLPGEGFDREVEVTIDFSGTEIFASVKNLKTFETSSISVDFLSKQC